METNDVGDSCMNAKEAKATMKNQVLATVSTRKLIEELWNRKDIISIQVWKTEDLIEAFEERGILKPDAALIKRVETIARKKLDDCSFGWGILESAVEMAIREECGG